MLDKSVDHIMKAIGGVPDVSIVLGSGLGKLADELDGTVRIPYGDIPGFMNSTAPGHAGELVSGRIGGKKVLLMNGRFHIYEGYRPQDIVYPIRVMKRLGVKKLILTNASGGIRLSFVPGQLVFIKDVINLSFKNPLVGPNEEKFGPRFPDMSQSLSSRWMKASNEAIFESFEEKLETGVYVSLLGPSYETPAEIRMLRKIGADMVGMSTIHEIIAANHAGLEVLGISCVTNMAAGVLDRPLSHLEVMEVGRKVSKHFVSIVKTIVEKTC